MWYILYMNKDVIYVEPEDDITDIITKIENAKERIVALVPPKKASVFRSIVNIKLINKAGASADKKIVLVTTDPSVLKLAAVAKLPVAKNLQTAPVVPELDNVVAETANEELVEKSDGAVAVEIHEEADETEVEEPNAKEAEDDTEKAEVAVKPSEKPAAEEARAKGATVKGDSTTKSSPNKAIDWILHHVKLLVGCGIGLVVLILVGIWMFVISPAADITVTIRTTESNFSESVSFVTKLQEENAAEGKFYIEEKKQETKSEVEFEATGEKNVGEKATGELIVQASFRSAGSTTLEKGSVFSNGELSYVTDENTTLDWDGVTMSGCVDMSPTDFLLYGCIVSDVVSVTAEKPGEQYNIDARASNWYSSTGFSAYSTKAMTGGSNKIVTVVQQSDIDKALGEINTGSEQLNREKLYNSISKERAVIIDDSFAQTVGEPVSTPALGEEVKEGTKAKLTVTTTDVISFIDKTKVEEFITKKAKLSDNFKIYQIENSYIDNFTKTEAGFAGKLKAIYVSGPKVTENDIVEIARGKGLGTAQHELSSINGVSKISIEPSHSWVNSIPNDPSRITITIQVDSSKGAN